MIAFLLALLAQPAHAGNSGPYMWGVGPSIATIAYPGRFPPAIPNDESGDNVNIEKVGGDLWFGLRGVAYMDKHYRGAVRAQLATGSGPNGNGFRGKEITFEADKILVGQNGMFAFAGGGLGFGTLHFEGDGGQELDLGTYVFRGQLGAYYKTKKQAYEFNLFLKLDWPGVQTFTKANGNEIDASGGNYLNGGLEATVYFGDFKPPKKKKKNKKK